MICGYICKIAMLFTLPESGAQSKESEVFTIVGTCFFKWHVRSIYYLNSMYFEHAFLITLISKNVILTCLKDMCLF
jgi:hypothetical protein